MGGNALKKLGIDTKRIPRAQYCELEAEVREILERYFEHVDVPHQLPSKPDFGDVDFVVCAPKAQRTYEHIRTALCQEFGSKASVVNGNVISFEYKDFQCDLIHFPTHSQQQACVAFFSWPDLGNILGVIARSLGFSLGMHGLSLRVSLPEELVKVSSVRKVALTDSLEETISFLGYNVEKWKKGFDNEQDIVQYALNGKYVCADVLDSLNRNDRKRSSLRPMFQLFLKEAGLRRASFGSTPSEDRRHAHRERALDHFSVRQMYLQEVLLETLQPKFRGMLQIDSFREASGLQAQDLGAFMKQWRESKAVQAVIPPKVRNDFRESLHEAMRVLRTSISADEDAIYDYVWSTLNPWHQWLLAAADATVVHDDMLLFFQSFALP